MGSDLVHSCMVGDVVSVTGWVKVLATGEGLGECVCVRHVADVAEFSTSSGGGGMRGPALPPPLYWCGEDEQLRNSEPAAFLACPADAFSSAGGPQGGGGGGPGGFGGGGGFRGGGGGNRQQQQQQGLFLIYVDAINISNAQRAVRGGSEAGTQGASQGGRTTQQGGNSQQATVLPNAAVGLPPNMPDFTTKDLEFVVTLMKVGLHGSCAGVLWWSAGG